MAEVALGNAVRTGMVKARPRRSEGLLGIVLALPALVLMLLLLFLPMVAVLLLAFTDWQLGASSARFVGLRNFMELVGDPTVRTAAANTVIYVVIVVPAVICIALVIALLIESSPRLRSFYRTVHFLPVMSTLAAMAVAWEMVLHPSIGVVNLALRHVGIDGPNWLGDERTALLSLAVIGVWEHLGFAMILIAAGLKTVPGEVHDAARLDGIHRPIDRLFLVTLPLLGPVLLFVTVIVATRAFQLFDTVAILTKGGPNKASEVLLHMIYVESFQFFRTGHGAALTLLFLVVVVSLTLAKARFLDARVHYA